MGLTVTVLLLAAAALTCLGVAIGVALSRRERRSATSAADLAGLAGTDTAVPVLAALLDDPAEAAAKDVVPKHSSPATPPQAARPQAAPAGEGSRGSSTLEEWA